VQSFAVIPDRAKLSAAGLTFRQSPMRSSATTATTVGPDDRRRGALIVRAEGAVKRRMISVNRTADATASCCACATSPKCASMR
jgi:hypothetical protein